MAEIVLELKRRNWTDKKIGKELGMDPDEVLRLSQITGVAEMFADVEFTEAWDVDSALGDLAAGDLGEEVEVSAAPGRALGPPVWDDRTDGKAVYQSGTRVFGQVKHYPTGWKWFFYGPPMDEGLESSEDDARAQVEQRI
jgi:hypothetical protein